MSDRREIRAGTVLGPYVLGESIGTGASAVVHAARDPAGKHVAIKVRRRGHEEMDRRFLREFESMRLLRVKGVVQVHDAGFDDDVMWFAMDRIDGRPLNRKILEGLPAREQVARVLAIGGELLRILASLHESGFVHRDIKPTNVLVDPMGGVHVLDFGIGRYFGDQDTLSNSGEVLGTVPYMSPEQLSGLPVDEKVDVWAAGLVLHECLVGRRERPSTTVGWIPRICLERPVALATVLADVPRGLSALIDRVLSVDPRDRPTAREAADELQRVARGARSATWPEPPFVDPGEWWKPIQGCIGNAPTGPVWVLEGPSGSGRRRLAETLHRLGLLQGTWTWHLRCRVDRVGGPILEALEIALAAIDDDELAPLLAPATTAIRALWPHLPLPWATNVADDGDDRHVEALARAVAGLASLRPILIVVHELERVDPFTARWLPLLARGAGPELGLLLLHEQRWATPLSKDVVATLRRERGAGVVTPPRFAAEAAQRIALGLCPPGASPPTFDRPTEPRVAVEAGWKLLAAWRGESFSLPEPSLWCLSVQDAPLPTQLFRALGGDERSDWIALDDEGATLDGPTARALVLGRVASLQRSAAALANAWEQQTTDHVDTARHLATLWLLAQDPSRAWAPALRAASADEALEAWSSARQWLLILDTLPPARRDPSEEFELARIQARVALYTDATTVRPTLVQLVERLARDPEHEQRARVLHAEYQLRLGQARPALVTALRVASPGSGAPSAVQVAASLLAVRCRLALRQIPEALRELERAEIASARLGDRSIHAVRISNTRAELALLQEDLLWCRALCQKNIRAAGKLGYARGEAEAAFRLGLVLRMLGRRREAEHRIRAARETYATSGDVALGAETGLALATLLVERCEPLPARHLLDQTIRAIRGLSMGHLMPIALRLALQVATLTASAPDAAVALDQLRMLGPEALDPETPAAEVHWWRTRGDIDRALDVEGPDDQSRSYGAVLWRLERARAAMAGGLVEVAETEARTALDAATDRGFAELGTCAQLVLGTVTHLDEDGWAELQGRAATSMWTEVFLGALEMDARKLQRTDPSKATERWRTLLARARELGYQPGVLEAAGWLQEDQP
ncbi:MAG: serine/threonine-protein kinase PknK [Alphaproteobacteria bacterium]|nr:serine/threonine-protein kinase PknK [Alphaproteobacteria bacterium]